MNAHYEKGRYFVPRRVPGEDTVFEPEDDVQSYMNQQFVAKRCQLMHYNVLIDSHNNLVYDFVWLCPDDDAVKEEPLVSQSDVP
jgi:uncharacterized UBP type Zn finger protein